MRRVLLPEFLSHEFPEERRGRERQRERVEIFLSPSIDPRQKILARQTFEKLLRYAIRAYWLPVNRIASFLLFFFLDWSMKLGQAERGEKIEKSNKSARIFFYRFNGWKFAFLKVRYPKTKSDIFVPSPFRFTVIYDPQAILFIDDHRCVRARYAFCLHRSSR